MKIKLVYGAPCCGKSTYVKEHSGEHDFIWDFDKLLMACTNRTGQTTGSHSMANFVIDLRKKIIDAVQSRPSVENLYITCLWVTDKLKSEVEGFDTEEIFIEATKEECFARLKADANRPDKDEWYKMINTWFKEHASDEKKAQNTTRSYKFWNFMRDEAGERVLRLDRAISDTTWFGDEITPQQFRDDLNAGEGDITVWINSPGGDVFAATEIYNMLKEYRGRRVMVKIDALAASSASIVAMAGDTIEISPLGQIFLHDPETMAEGNVGEFNAAIQMLREVKEGIITIYEQRTHLLRAQISELMTAATWLNAKKSVELGFADKIIGEENPQQIAQPAASFSQRTVTNSLATAFKAKRAAEKKPAVKCARRRRRLKVIEQFCETKRPKEA